MSREYPAAPDWRNADSYAPLLSAGRASFAWEWLRRDAAYRAAAHGVTRPEDQTLRQQDAAAAFGLHALEDPLVPSWHARPIWRSDRDPFVLQAVAAACKGSASGDAFDLRTFAGFSTLVYGRSSRQHVVLAEGHRTIRLDVRGASLLGGPVMLRYRLSGLRWAQAPLLALRRLLALCRTGQFSTELHRADARAARMILVLRTADAIASGADQREIASVLLSSEAGAARWRVNAPTLRSQVQRLVRSARLMSAGGWAALLAERQG